MTCPNLIINGDVPELTTDTDDTDSDEGDRPYNWRVVPINTVNLNFGVGMLAHKPAALGLLCFFCVTYNTGSYPPLVPATLRKCVLLDLFLGLGPCLGNPLRGGAVGRLLQSPRVPNSDKNSVT